MLAIVLKHDPELFCDISDTIKDYMINHKKRKRVEEEPDEEGAAVKKPKGERGRPSSVKLLPIIETFVNDDTNMTNNPRLLTIMKGLLAKYQSGPNDDSNKFKGQLQTAYNILTHIKDGEYTDDKYDDIYKDPWVAYDTHGQVAKKAARR